MIAINLLPWREKKLKTKIRNIFAQTLGLLSLTLILSGFLWAKNVSSIENQLANLKSLKADNGDVFAQLEDFQSSQRVYLEQQQRTEKINQLISERQIIPTLLGLLENKKLSFQVDHLLINHKVIRLKGNNISSSSVLSLLNTLREESEFCQVTFTPHESKLTKPTMAFELQAQICNAHDN